MTTAVKAIYEHGVFNPLEPIWLDELTEVEVLVPSAAADAENPGLERDRRRIGFIRNAQPDMAEHHDRYLYDQPRE